MKKFVLTILLALPLMIFAQQGQGKGQGMGPGGGIDREDRLKSLQIAYLTRELNITPTEAEKFWPVYNKYQDEMRTAMKSSKDADVLDKQQQMLDIRKKYKNDFSKILNPERTNQLFDAEGKFREMVKRELQERREMMEKRQQKRLN